MKTIIFNKGKMLIFILLAFGFQIVHGQNAEMSYFTIKGKVKDDAYKREVVFATVSILGTHIGTVTNTDGEFTIKIKKSSGAKKLEFSHIGFNNKTIPISELKADGNMIFLKSSSMSLDEVTIRPADAKDLVRNALALVPLNYSAIPLYFTGFYRETVKQRRDYISISEAIVDIYKGAYSKEYDYDKAKIYKGRKSANVKRSDTLAVRLQGGPYISLLLDIIKNPNLLMASDIIDDYEYELTNIISVSNKLNYMVTFKPKYVDDEFPLYTGKYYIEVKSLAITSAEFSLDIKDKEKASKYFVRKKPIGLKLTPMSTNYIIKFKETNGKYYFNYARSEVKFKCKWKKKLFNTNYTIMSEMAMTDWNASNVTKFSKKESLKKNTVFADELTAFMDDDFWGEYNFIEPDESIESAIKKYNKRIKKQNN
ncbi:MAG: hypothetical protein B6I20_10225 [Bacteroidetes bacterium 4572_117]|nr:MAG: hypothetical protein B6I20_10225 [Bacteroidetes bacterium 4572_117]